MEAIFLLTFFRIKVIFKTQSESVTLSVDYLISSTQAGFTCLGFFLRYNLPPSLKRYHQKFLIQPLKYY